MHRLKALLIIIAACGLSLHAHATNGTQTTKTTPDPSDSLKTSSVSKLITFGIFTLKAVKKEDRTSKKTGIEVFN